MELARDCISCPREDEERQGVAGFWLLEVLCRGEQKSPKYIKGMTWEQGGVSLTLRMRVQAARDAISRQQGDYYGIFSKWGRDVDYIKNEGGNFVFRTKGGKTLEGGVAGFVNIKVTDNSTFSFIYKGGKNLDYALKVRYTGIDISTIFGKVDLHQGWITGDLLFDNSEDFIRNVDGRNLKHRKF
jgi:hypothetical protein